MVMNFEEWWCSEDADGVVPRLYIRSLLQKLRMEFKLIKFSFVLSQPELEIRITKYFSLLHQIVYNNLQKQIDGPNCLISAPRDWNDREEHEWQEAYHFNFESLFCEKVLGPEKSWEYRVIKWRYALPSILMRYTVRSRDNLPHAEEEINSDGEYESYTDAD